MWIDLLAPQATETRVNKNPTSSQVGIGELSSFSGVNPWPGLLPESKL